MSYDCFVAGEFGNSSQTLNIRVLRPSGEGSSVVFEFEVNDQDTSGPRRKRNADIVRQLETFVSY